ncbi:hypothetical protein C7S20_12955 [Christiangramia fulva]|uniref:DUF2141 domain-containing protein n=1 Tax=Christiangramia fulva TaxID=2126553 RepID=A0A2R3Z744_9FLAO|nr:DUF2141 domain-containing protein [Christiangramia fulva]AVR46090.1 hypothetical protein C7S20_12955 [Christiangramia fulva]
MKTLILLLAMLMGSLLYSQNSAENTGNITVNVPNAQTDEGAVLFALYSEDNFLQGKPVYSAYSEITDGKATGIFENVPSGTYSIVFFHDENNNKKMDFDENGMPLENYATSGETASYGPPNWDESNFIYDGSDRLFEIRF